MGSLDQSDVNARRSLDSTWNWFESVLSDSLEFQLSEKIAANFGHTRGICIFPLCRQKAEIKEVFVKTAENRVLTALGFGSSRSWAIVWSLNYREKLIRACGTRMASAFSHYFARKAGILEVFVEKAENRVLAALGFCPSTL